MSYLRTFGTQKDTAVLESGEDEEEALVLRGTKPSLDCTRYSLTIALYFIETAAGLAQYTATGSL